MLRKLYDDGVKAGQVRPALRQAEVELCLRLLAGPGDATGIVGANQPGKPVVQPPSATYWGLLQLMGVVPFSARRGRAPSLAELANAWPDRKAPVVHDEDGQLVSGPRFPLDLSVPVPEAFLEVPLSLQLSAEERTWARRRLAAIPQFGKAGRPIALLGRLAEDGSQLDLWATIRERGVDARRWIAKRGFEDADVLDRAARAASLGAVARAVYAALVERMREDDGVPSGRKHRTALAGVVDDHGEFAAPLDLDLVSGDAAPGHGSRAGLSPGSSTRRMFDRTLAWLRSDAPTDDLAVWELYGSYRAAEHDRKQHKARLTVDGKSRRRAWEPEEHGHAEPLHFRAGVATTFLADLQDAQS